MYTLVSAYAVPNTPQAHWATVDLSSVLVNTIYQTYRQVYLTLTSPVLTGNVHVNLTALQTTYQGFDGTLAQLLTSLGSNSLPTVPSIPTPNPKYVHYADAFAVGYKAELVTSTGSLTAATREQLTMLRLSRSNPEPTNMRTFYKNCLVSINGFYHITDTDGHYTYVIDAGKSSVKSRQNQVGILNFMDIGELEIIPITPDMIYNQGNGSLLKERAYIKLPSQYSTAGKVPMLVMGGYLNFVGNSFWESGDNTFSVDFHAMRMLSRFYESLPYIDYDYLGLSGTQKNIDQVALSQFFSDEVLTKYMTSSQSFVVLVNSTQLFTNKIRLRGAKLPGMFVSEVQPRYPLIMGYGRVGEYWKTYEDNQWSINVVDNLLNHRVFDYSDTNALNSVSDQRVPYQRYDFSRGYFLEIGCDF